MEFNEFKEKILSYNNDNLIGDYFMEILNTVNKKLYNDIVNSVLNVSGSDYINEFLWRYIKVNW